MKPEEYYLQQAQKQMEYELTRQYLNTMDNITYFEIMEAEGLMKYTPLVDALGINAVEMEIFDEVFRHQDLLSRYVSVCRELKADDHLYNLLKGRL